MSTETELKLLTLLNVSAIKKPRDLDIPGGHRGSPSQSGSRDGSPAVKPAQPKKRKVIFGGELGPSGSTFGKKSKVAENGGVKEKSKGKGKEVNGNGNDHAGEPEHSGQEGGNIGEIELDEGSDEETTSLNGEYHGHAQCVGVADNQMIITTCISRPSRIS